MKMSSVVVAPIALPVLSALSAQVNQPRDESNSCSVVRYPPPSVRPPPKDGYQGHNFGQWMPPPPENLYGIYHITHTSYEQPNSSLVNLWIERYPIFPANEDFPTGSEAVIESWSTCSDPGDTSCKDQNAVSTVFGHDIPIGTRGPTDKSYTAAWSYAATGSLEGRLDGLRAIIAWGEDNNGFGYLAQYQTGGDVNRKAADSIVIASRNEEGMSSATYMCLSSSLKQIAEELEDEELSSLVSQINPIQHDHRRDGEGPIECDTSCVNNTGFESNDAQQLQRRGSSSMQLPFNDADTHKQILYPLGIRRGGYLPWWGWMIMGLVFGLPLLGGLCVAVPVALFRGHRRRRFARVQRAAQESVRASQARGSSSVAEPQMTQTA